MTIVSILRLSPPFDVSTADEPGQPARPPSLVTAARVGTVSVSAARVGPSSVTAERGVAS